MRSLILSCVTGLNPSSSRDSPLHLMDYESASLGPVQSAGGRRAHAALEEQLLSYSENAENEGEEEAYLEEEVLQVCAQYLVQSRSFCFQSHSLLLWYPPHTPG